MMQISLTRDISRKIGDWIELNWYGVIENGWIELNWCKQGSGGSAHSHSSVCETQIVILFELSLIPSRIPQRIREHPTPNSNFSAFKRTFIHQKQDF
jgi:hypothetical protein